MKLFRDARLPYYKLYEGFESKPTNIIAESDGHDSVTDFSSTEKRVEECLSMLAPGKYLLSARENFKSNQSGINVRFDIPHAWGTNGSQPAAIGNTNALSPELKGWIHPAEHRAAIERMELNKKLEDMQRSMDEAAKKKEPKLSPLDKFLDQHGSTLIPAVIGLLTQKFAGGAIPQQVGLSGFDSLPVPVKDDKQPAVDDTAILQQKINYAIAEATRQENGNTEAAIDLLLRVVIWRKENEATYQSLLKPILASIDINTIDLTNTNQ